MGSSRVYINKKKKQKQALIFFAVFGIVVFLFGVLAGSKGFTGIMDAFSSYNIFANLKLPSNGEEWKNALTGAFLFTIVYAFVASFFILNVTNARPDDGKGSDELAEPKDLCKIYANTADPQYNKLLTRNFKLSYDNAKAARNANTIVIGGSGAGKTFRLAIPNLCNAATSFVDIDPKGEHLLKAGNRLVKLGYDVKVLNLIQPEQSDGYNPFRYIRPKEAENDIAKLVEILFSASAEGAEKKQDPFWDNAAKNVILALMYYVYFEYPPARRHFGSVMELKRLANITESRGNGRCKVDDLMDKLKEEKPESLALRYWKEYEGNDIKVKRDILAVVGSKLLKFNNDALVNLTRFDDLDFDSLGERKRIIFIVISDSDKSMNFIVSMLYTQMFQRLFEVADFKYNGSLPIHVAVMLDEFANIKLPDSFEQYLSTMRSRNVSATIIIQNLAQIKALFEKQWESLVGNCDTLLYLGGNSYETAEYISKLMGFYTLDTKTYTTQHGSKATGGSDNSGSDKRELMMASEIRKLPNEECICVVRGENPMIDEKLNILDMPIKQYSSYDKKEGKYFVRVIEDMFAYGESDIAEQKDATDMWYRDADSIPADGYLFRTSDEIREACQHIYTATTKKGR